MSNQFNCHTTKIFTQFLDHSCQTKNLPAIKTLHAHLIRTGLLFFSLNIHSKIVLTYTISLKNNNLKTLTNCCKFINTNNPYPFNLLLSDFCRNGFPFYALKTCSLMHTKSVPLDSYALSSSLVASSSVKDLKFGKQVHAYLIKSGWLASVYVGSALIDLYAKLSFLSDAAKVFDEIPVKNTVCANALLSGYAEDKTWDQGIKLIRRMPILNLDYDHLTISAMLRTCAGLSAIEFGKQVHAYLTRKIHDIDNDMFLQSALIEMYGKCGFVEKALQVFNLGGNRERDIVLWTSMLGVCGRSGHFNQVIELFNEMLKQGIRPDGVAYVTVISACSRSGQVQLGIEYFESMSRDFGINPGPEHYSCVVDLLCKAGELDKAWKLAMEMVSKGHEIESASISMWGALLSACEEHGNIELGKLAAQEALKLEPQNVGIYVLLSNLYATFGMWDDIACLRETMKDRALLKDVGCSWIQATS
ncbi:pentatricopeptide repeat-containing protein At2g03880, mitochondrial-like [Euphorbia lathyris]|uniref:pentatricopeptide repeat-containing protein At2g03880, mitochondrial-like n=1 Tax=Euphorbia lathyris TaxID=212925 RepID=UPI0033133190